MAWTRVQGFSQTAQFSSGGPFVNTQVTLGSAVAIGDTLCVGCTSATDVRAASPTLTDSLGNTYVLKQSTYEAADDTTWLVYVCIVTVAGTPTLTFDPGTSNQNWLAIFGDHFTGSSAASTTRDSKINAQINPSSPGTGADAITSTSVAAQNGDLEWSITSDDSIAAGGAVAVGTGYTAGVNFNSVVRTEWKTASGSGAGTFTDATNGATHNYVTAGVAITPATSALGRRPSFRARGPRVRLFAPFPVSHRAGIPAAPAGNSIATAAGGVAGGAAAAQPAVLRGAQTRGSGGSWASITVSVIRVSAARGESSGAARAAAGALRPTIATGIAGGAARALGGALRVTAADGMGVAAGRIAAGILRPANARGMATTAGGVAVSITHGLIATAASGAAGAYGTARAGAARATTASGAAGGWAKWSAFVLRIGFARGEALGAAIAAAGLRIAGQARGWGGSWGTLSSHAPEILGGEPLQAPIGGPSSVAISGQDGVAISGSDQATISGQFGATLTGQTFEVD